MRQAGVAIWMAIPSIFLIVLIMGDVLSGIFTPTEASAIAVIYTLFLALVLYREISVKDLPKIFLESVIYHCNCLVINWFFDGNVMGNVKR